MPFPVIIQNQLITGIPFGLSLAKDMGVNDLPVSADKDLSVRPVEGWTRKTGLSLRQTVHASTLLSMNDLSGTVVREVIFDEVLSPIYSVLRQTLRARIIT